MKDYQKDMDFYFNHSASALGLTSTYGSFIRQLEGASIIHGVNNAELSINFKAIKRYNRIHSIFKLFDPQERAILKSYFDHERQFYYHITLRACFGDYAGPALFHPHLYNLFLIDHIQVRVLPNKQLKEDILRWSKSTIKQLGNKYEENLCK